MLESILTILTIAEKGTKLYDWFTGASIGANADRLLEQRRGSGSILKISDRIFVDESVKQVSSNKSILLSDQKMIKLMVEPISDEINGTVFTSQIDSTPIRLRLAFEKDPWSVLDDVRPLKRIIHEPRPGWVPIQFIDEGQPYVGWQKKGMLPQMFDCDFDERWPPFVKSNYKNTNSLSSINVYDVVSGKKQIIPRNDFIDIFSVLFPILNRHADNLFIYGLNFPIQKKLNFIKSSRLSHDIEILAFIDTSMLGDGKNGLAFTYNGMHYINGWLADVKEGFLSYEEFSRYNVNKVRYDYISIGSRDHLFVFGPIPFKKTFDFLTELSSSIKKQF